jgi:hypothetical protein
MKSGEQSLRIWVEDNSVTISNVIFLNVQAERKHLQELCLGVHKSFPNALFNCWLAGSPKKNNARSITRAIRDKETLKR